MKARIAACCGLATLLLAAGMRASAASGAVFWEAPSGRSECPLGAVLQTGQAPELSYMEQGAQAKAIRLALPRGCEAELCTDGRTILVWANGRCIRIVPGTGM